MMAPMTVKNLITDSGMCQRVKQDSGHLIDQMYVEPKIWSMQNSREKILGTLGDPQTIDTDITARTSPTDITVTVIPGRRLEATKTEMVIEVGIAYLRGNHQKDNHQSIMRAMWHRVKPLFPSRARRPKVSSVSSICSTRAWTWTCSTRSWARCLQTIERTRRTRPRTLTGDET